MKRRTDEDDGSLDSLLDTLSNVVGILVIMLVITQLSVGESVKQMGESEQVAPEALARAQADLEQTRRQEQALQAQLASLTASPEEIQQRLAQLEREKAATAAEMRAAEAKRRAEQDAARRAADEVEKKLAAQKKEQETQQQQLRRTLEQIKQLEAKLASVPAAKPAPSKIINLPDPRPAPKDAQPVTFFCWRGKMFSANLEELRDRARKRFDYVVTRYKLDRNPATGLDAKEVCARFNEDPIREKFFDVELTAVGVYPNLKLTPKLAAGESATDIARSASDFQVRLRKTRAGQNYARFLVWPDSFEIYLAGREVADERNVPAGWQLITDRPDYLYAIGGGRWRFGPAPKPSTQPAKPTAPPPPPPSDQID